MIHVKSEKEIDLMREPCKIVKETLEFVGSKICAGMSTKEVDELVERYIRASGANPSCLGYGGFPGSACISVNEQVIHGIPSEKVILREGDIVKIDVGARYRGYNGDSARTFPVGKVSDEALRLISVTEKSFYEAMKYARASNRVGDIGAAVENFVISNGFKIVRKYVGHGVGAEIHEDPSIPNPGIAGRGARLYPGMTLAIEPMVNAGTERVKVRKDGWTVVTADGKLSAHYENSIAITSGDPIILTKAE